MKNINEFLATAAQSCKREGPHDRIVMSSRVRLARNLQGIPFPGWAKKPDRVKALEGRCSAFGRQELVATESGG